MLTVLCLSLLTQADVSIPQKTSPVYLPRTASLLTQINNGAVILSPRIAWEVLLIEQPRNDFVMFAELGPGFGIGRPVGISNVWSHVGIVGFGLRLNLKSGFRAGLGVGFGGSIHGFTRGDVTQARIDPYLEGRIQVGWQFGPVVVSIFGGWGGTPLYAPRIESLLYSSGPTVGISVDWKRPYQ